MDNIEEYVWAILAIILTVASLFKSTSTSKRQRQRNAEIPDTEIPSGKDRFDAKFEELRKNIETTGRSEQLKQTVVQHQKSTPTDQPNAHKPAHSSISVNSNDGKQYVHNGRFSSSATVAVADTEPAAKTHINHSDMPKFSDSENNGENTELGIEQFNLRDAIIYSEIMKPKFDSFR